VKWHGLCEIAVSPPKSTCEKPRENGAFLLPQTFGADLDVGAGGLFISHEPAGISHEVAFHFTRTLISHEPVHFTRTQKARRMPGF
jgi:hypothetical protein